MPHVKGEEGHRGRVDDERGHRRPVVGGEGDDHAFVGRQSVVVAADLDRQGGEVQDVEDDEDEQEDAADLHRSGSQGHLLLAPLRDLVLGSARPTVAQEEAGGGARVAEQEEEEADPEDPDEPAVGQDRVE